MLKKDLIKSKNKPNPIKRKEKVAKKLEPTINVLKPVEIL